MWLVSMHMGYLAPYFSTAQFCKLSRSLMINLNYLERVERNQIWLKNHPIALPISDKNRTELMARLPVIRTP
jgi:DNA-binding LytR/AlgR family response regulator